MSHVDDLIKELAPRGVQFKTLGEVCEVLNGFAFKSELFNTSGDGVPLIRIRDVNTGFSETYYSGEYDDRYVVLNGDILIGMDGDFRATRWKHGRALLNQRVCRLQEFRPEMLADFMYYYVQDELNRIQEGTSGSTVKHLSSRELERSRIPVPPLEVQAEIVRILDHFTALEAELEAELEARRLQHAFYRDELLTFPESAGVRRVPMGELADFKYGFTASAQDSGDYRFLRITDISPWGKLLSDGAKFVPAEPAVSEYVVEPGDLLMARTGATFGKTMLVSSAAPAVYASFLIRIRFKRPNVLPAYYWHFAQSDLYWSQANAMVSTGGQPQFNANVLKLVEVPVPPVEAQERIVALLDKFDALVNDLSIGLPAELNARRKQYEYYRDKLLTFEEAAA